VGGAWVVRGWCVGGAWVVRGWCVGGAWVAVGAWGRREGGIGGAVAPPEN
jgi:hypothetical protein